MLKNQIASDPSVTIICGSSGTGKTTFLIRYLLNSPEIRCRFLFDPKGEFAQRLRIAPASTPQKLLSAILTGWVVFDPSEMFPGQTREAQLFFAEFAYEYSSQFEGRKLYVLDELQSYCTPHTVPDELALILETGRKQQLEFVGLSQRPNSINGDVMNQWTELVVFRLGGINDVKRLNEYGFDRDELLNLPRLRWISKSSEGGEMRGTIDPTA